MRQYNHTTTGATFSVIDYGERKYGPRGDYSVNVVYSDGKTFIHSQGWVNSIEEAHELVRSRAKMFGVKLTGFERVA